MCRLGRVGAAQSGLTFAGLLFLISEMKVSSKTNCDDGN